jgi:hypothetical protein
VIALELLQVIQEKHCLNHSFINCLKYSTWFYFRKGSKFNVCLKTIVYVNDDNSYQNFNVQTLRVKNNDFGNIYWSKLHSGQDNEIAKQSVPLKFLQKKCQYMYTRI